MIWDKFLERVDTKAHIPVGVGIFVVGTALQVFHRMDATFVAFVSSVLGFLGAHAVWAQPPDTKPKEEK
jgi:Na+/melibiose symporter-like transporter